MGIIERQNHFKLNEGKGQVRVKSSKWMQIHMQEMEQIYKYKFPAHHYNNWGTFLKISCV